MRQELVHIDIEKGLFERLSKHKAGLEEKLKVSCTWGEYFEAMLPSGVTA